MQQLMQTWVCLVPFILFPSLRAKTSIPGGRLLGDRKGTTKKLCDKDFAERSGELSGAIRLKTLVLLGDNR